MVGNILMPDRRRMLLEQLQEHGSVTIAELAAALGVSDVTVRRDVNDLVRQGLAERFHGGVTLPKPPAHPATAADPPAYPAPAYPAPSAPSSHLPAPARRGAAEPDGPAEPRRSTSRTTPRQLRVGVMMPSAGYYREVLNGAAEAASRMNVTQAFVLSRYDPERDLAAIKALIRDGLDGLLLTPSFTPGTNYTPFAEELRELPVPVVLAERRLDPSVLIDRLDHVLTDHDAGARLAVEHLAGLGHRRIALVLKNLGPTAPSIAAGHAYAIRSLGLDEGLPVFTVPQMDTVLNGVDAEFGEVVDRLLAAGPTAAVVHGDPEAVALEQLLLERGVRVPEDLALISYDDDMAAFAAVPLSAVAPPKRLIGWTGIDLLARRIRLGESRPVQHVTLMPSLVVRDSCGARRAAGPRP
jgi:DNA-binding LacI/PurR family transcriptional regulator